MWPWSKKIQTTVKKDSRPVNFHVTLWPTFSHFLRFAKDSRIQGIRLNSAMMDASEIDSDFVRRSKKATVPLWFDIKGMQLRIREVVCDHHHDHLEFILNRPVKVELPCRVEFKAGEDAGKCIEIRNGTHFIFEGGPRYEVRAGESIHIRAKHEVGGPVFLDYELEKLDKICKLGIPNYYLSYVYDQKHVDEFRAIIGSNSDLFLKIENKAGLNWVANNWKAQPNTHLTAARGDLYVELTYPHEIMKAVKMIVEADPEACVGSRMLLSLVPPSPKTLEFLQYAGKTMAANPLRHLYEVAKEFKDSIEPPNVPRCADLSDLAWLYDIGYRNFLLCDELCLYDNLLGRAVTVFDAFRDEYHG